MRRKILLRIAVLSSVLLVFCSIKLVLRWDNFHGITDDKVLPLLKDLPSTSERGNISATDGRFLYEMIIEKGYKHGLELGTSNGYSALWQGLAFRMTGGSLVTVEIDSIIASEAKSNFKKAGLDNIIDQRINDAFFEVSSMRDSLDFVFIDCGEYNFALFNLALPLIKNGGCLVMHNVHKGESGTKKIMANSDIKTTFKKRFFYNILVSTK
jgi:predicted O-methyltransferase YrrM